MRVADLKANDVVELAPARRWPPGTVVRVGWHIGRNRDAFVRRYSEATGLVGGHWFVVPYHVQVLRVIDPSAAGQRREQGDADG